MSEQQGKAMKVADQGADFAANVPTIHNAVAKDRKVQAFIDGGFQDVESFLEKFARQYIKAMKDQHPGVNIVFDFHVGEPALIGGTYSYNWVEGRFRSWYWTEQPDLVDAMTALEAKEAFHRSVAKFR